MARRRQILFDRRSFLDRSRLSSDARRNEQDETFVIPLFTFRCRDDGTSQVTNCKGMSNDSSGPINEPCQWSAKSTDFGAALLDTDVRRVHELAKMQSSLTRQWLPRFGVVRLLQSPCYHNLPEPAPARTLLAHAGLSVPFRLDDKVDRPALTLSPRRLKAASGEDVEGRV
jgi:hypothetical protein